MEHTSPPPVRRVLIGGHEYVNVSDLRAWLNYVADGMVQEGDDLDTRRDMRIARGIIRVLTGHPDGLIKYERQT